MKRISFLLYFALFSLSFHHELKLTEKKMLHRNWVQNSFCYLCSISTRKIETYQRYTGPTHFVVLCSPEYTHSAFKLELGHEKKESNPLLMISKKKKKLDIRVHYRVTRDVATFTYNWKLLLYVSWHHLMELVIKNSGLKNVWLCDA